MLQFHEKHFSGPKLKEFFDKKGSWSYLAELYFRKAIEENKIKVWATSHFFLYDLQHNVTMFCDNNTFKEACWVLCDANIVAHYGKNNCTQSTFSNSIIF